MQLLIVIGVILLLIAIFKGFSEHKGLFFGGCVLIGLGATVISFIGNAIKGGYGKPLITAVAVIAALIVLLIVVNLVKKAGRKANNKKNNERALKSFYHGSLKDPRELFKFTQSECPGVDEADREQAKRLAFEYGWETLKDPSLGVMYAIRLGAGNAEEKAKGLEIAREIADTGYVPAIGVVITICWWADVYDLDLEYAQKLIKLNEENTTGAATVLEGLEKTYQAEAPLDVYCRARNYEHYREIFSKDREVVGKDYDRRDPKSVINGMIDYLEKCVPKLELLAKMVGLLGEGPGLECGDKFYSKFGNIEGLTFEEYKRSVYGQNCQLSGIGDIFLDTFFHWDMEVTRLDERRKKEPALFSVIAKSKLEKLMRKQWVLKDTKEAVLRDAEEVFRLLEEDRIMQKILEMKNLKVGDSIEFGKYPQNESGEKTPVEWKVLAREGNKALLLSKELLALRTYGRSYTAINSEGPAICWAKSDIRDWLNNEFLKTAFSEDERSKIVESEIETLSFPEGGEMLERTTDKVFLLSVEEAEKYFETTDHRTCRTTEYAAKIGRHARAGYRSWLLRTPGKEPSNVTFVRHYGVVNEFEAAYTEVFGIRPAIWIVLTM